jgi:hypothetical protein
MSIHAVTATYNPEYDQLEYRGGTVTDRVARAVVDREKDLGESWQSKAACGSNPKLMDVTRDPEIFEAVKVCATCPVKTECRLWADQEKSYVGVAGGRIYTTRMRGKHPVRRRRRTTAKAS